MRAFLLTSFALGLFGGTLNAQSAHWDPPGGSLPAGQTTELQLVFEDCEPKDTPAPPKVSGLSLEYSGQANNMSFVNGTYSHTISYTYAALLAKKQTVEIPPFEVQTNKGVVRVAPARFDPVGATVGGNQSLESAAHSRIETTPTSVWAGEVFQIDYTIQAARGYYPDFGHGAFDWNSEPLVVEDWTQPEPLDDRSAAQPQTGLVYRTRAIARKTGNVALNPISQLVNLSIGVSGFGFFQQRQYQQFSVTSTAPSVEVRALPPAPAGFSGAVGDFKLAGKVVPESAAVGEPVTWTLELSGTGNWPDISGLPPREVSKDFQVIQPKAKRSPAAGKLFDSKLTEDVVLVPTKPGTYALSPVRFIYFNPKSGTYQTLTSPGATVTVAPANENTQPSPEKSQSGSGKNPPSTAMPQPAVPALPSGLPRDPLPMEAAASRPLNTASLAAALLTPLALFVIFWLGLARQRARLTDPLRPLREARGRLADTLARIRMGAPYERQAFSSLLLEWQRDSAVLWQIGHAAPLASAIADPQWAALWAQAEAAIYSADGSLSADWLARAEAALAQKKVPSFGSLQLFKPRNLVPFIGFALLMAGFVCSGLSAAPAEAPSSPDADYRKGDFAAAEKGWRAVLAHEPAAWSARHNLSLALAQEDHWDESAAQAAAAFVQNPGNAAVRWQFALACTKAGFIPGPLGPFLSPGPFAALASRTSPAGWQRILAGAALLAAIALGALLAFAYGLMPRARWLPPLACSILALALLLGLVSSLGWRAYGLTADTQAAVAWRSGTLRSIPTEADTSQKTVPLPAGSVGRADRSFLGWERLTFENGQTGWVRKEELVWLWQ